ncbi:MAG: hypothetical protein QF827_05815 [Alphaproteobacteria bacterium]|jgi:hypothetical protein|nr:hypothetical protein [Alphaproteobacteria bacterium]
MAQLIPNPPPANHCMDVAATAAELVRDHGVEAAVIADHWGQIAIRAGDGTRIGAWMRLAEAVRWELRTGMAPRRCSWRATRRAVMSGFGSELP